MNLPEPLQYCISKLFTSFHEEAGKTEIQNNTFLLVWIFKSCSWAPVQMLEISDFALFWGEGVSITILRQRDNWNLCK